MRMKWKLTVACMKMFFREKEALFWTIFLPLFMIVLFGLVKFDPARVAIGIVNEADKEGEEFRKSLMSISTLTIHEGNRSEEFRSLGKGERDLVVVLPPNFRLRNMGPIQVFTNDAKPQEAQLGVLLVQQVLDKMIFDRALGISRSVVHAQPVKSRKLSYMDFLVPGILAMSIMQMGIFSVAFVFVDLKKRGILRRLRVTPVNPNDFIFAQIVTRLLVLLMQIVVLTVVGIVFFHLNFAGNLLNMFVIGVLGAIVFLGIGFAVAGISKSEEQVAPLANVITMPMLLLSGVFFSRANLPGFAHAVTDYFPLTYLADALRSVAIDGASLFQIYPQLIGLGIWCAISTALAVRFFRWE